MSQDFNAEPATSPAQSTMTSPAGRSQKPTDEAARRCHAYYQALGLARRAPTRLLVTDRKA